MKSLLRASLLLLLLATGPAFAGGLRLERILGPEVPTGPYKHPASVTELRNGDRYVVFFSGRGEYKDSKAAVHGIRRARGSDVWTAPVPIATHPFHSLGNAVVWEAPDGVVWLFYVVRYGEIWSDSRIAARISTDGARTWSEPTQITFEAGTMVRNRPVVTSDGSYLLPIYHEVGTDTEQTDGACTSLFLRYDSRRRLWLESNRVRSRLGNLQPAPALIDGDRLVAFCRRGGDYQGRPDGWLVRTESRDGGKTWSDGVDSEFPNPNAAVDFLRLSSGHHLLVYNRSFTNRTPLSVALSVDGAKSFPFRRDLIAEPGGDYGYPTAIQTAEGTIEVVFTSDERSVIRRAIFDEAWVRE